MRGRAALVLVVIATGCTPPHVLRGYGKTNLIVREKDGSQRYRDDPHRGVDFRTFDQGEAAIAAAAGTVVLLREVRNGVEVVLEHPDAGLFTAYRVLSGVLVRDGDVVARGQPLGTVAPYDEDQPYNREVVPHLHFELCTNVFCQGEALDGTRDPLAISAGCFSGSKVYPDELVLTFPVPC